MPEQGIRAHEEGLREQGRRQERQRQRRRQSGRAQQKKVARSMRARARGIAPSPRSYAAAEAVTLTALITYDIQGKTGTKMPRPGPIVATLAFYALLAAAGSVSRGAAMVAVAVGWVLALSVLVTGRRGRGIVGLLKQLSGWVGALGASSPASSTPATATSGG